MLFSPDGEFEVWPGEQHKAAQVEVRSDPKETLEACWGAAQS